MKVDIRYDVHGARYIAIYLGTTYAYSVLTVVVSGMVHTRVACTHTGTRFVPGEDDI